MTMTGKKEGRLAANGQSSTQEGQQISFCAEYNKKQN